MTRALFLCGKARMRSPTAADLAATWPGVQTDFAGLSHDADEKLGLEQVLWADVIFVMERGHAARLKALFPKALRGKRVIALNIPDDFSYGDPALVDLLTIQLRPRLVSGK
jgi:predicted protein tyrosine phosphatase